ncbi:hypothetical protein [Halomonas mongoliensis]|uniref:hypothetical protein n=1 Tax=Halomonas mongoliensis TaxID=321265 RepID=UPI00403A97AB
MMTHCPPEILAPEQMVGRLYHEAVTRYYPLFSEGAYLAPSTTENRAAVQCLLEAWPAIEAAMRAPGKQSSPQKMGDVLKLIIAARTIRENLESGFKIVEAKTKTPGTTPRG